jgi:hypothetical protein
VIGCKLYSIDEFIVLAVIFKPNQAELCSCKHYSGQHQRYINSCRFLGETKSSRVTITFGKRKKKIMAMDL